MIKTERRGKKIQHYFMEGYNAVDPYTYTRHTNIHPHTSIRHTHTQTKCTYTHAYTHIHTDFEKKIQSLTSKKL